VKQNANNRHKQQRHGWDVDEKKRAKTDRDWASEYKKKWRD